VSPIFRVPPVPAQVGQVPPVSVTVKPDVVTVPVEYGALVMIRPWVEYHSQSLIVTNSA
jgi:hypothetical protein